MKRLATSLALALAGMAAAADPAAADSADDHFSRGYSDHRSGNLKAAVKQYTKAIDRDGTFVMAYQMRGAAWQKLRQFSRAIEDYSKVISLGDTPFRASGYFNRGIARNMSGRYNEAIADFTRATDLDVKMGAAYFHRGIARSKTGDIEGLQDDFIRAARLGDPDAERWLDTNVDGWRRLSSPK